MPRLEFTNGFGRAVEAASFPLLTMAGLGVLMGLLGTGRGPVDWRYTGFVLTVSVVLAVLVVVPYFLLRRRLKRVVLTESGIPGLGVAWRDVTGIRPVWRGYARLVGVGLPGRRRVLLGAPLGAWWRPDPRFAANLKTIRGYAAQHGARVDGRVPGRRCTAYLAAVALLTAVAIGALSLSARGVVAPWSPVADAVPSACHALERAGLAKHWPTDARIGRATGVAVDDSATASACQVEPAPEFIGEPPYTLLQLSVYVWRDAALHTGTTTAVRLVGQERDRRDAAELPGLGDEAVTRDDGTTFHLLVRRANVTVRIAIERSKASGDVAGAARDLAAGVLRQIRFD